LDIRGDAHVIVRWLRLRGGKGRKHPLVVCFSREHKGSEQYNSLSSKVKFYGQGRAEEKKKKHPACGEEGFCVAEGSTLSLL